MKACAVVVVFALAGSPASSQGTDFRADTPEEAARMVAHFDFLRADCGVQVAVNGEEKLRALIYRTDKSYIRLNLIRDLETEAKKYGLRRVCRGLAEAYGISVDAVTAK